MMGMGYRLTSAGVYEACGGAVRCEVEMLETVSCEEEMVEL